MKIWKRYIDLTFSSEITQTLTLIKKGDENYSKASCSWVQPKNISRDTKLEKCITVQCNARPRGSSNARTICVPHYIHYTTDYATYYRCSRFVKVWPWKSKEWNTCISQKVGYACCSVAAASAGYQSTLFFEKTSPSHSGSYFRVQNSRSPLNKHRPWKIWLK